ncbi:unnamed protein product [Urochloa humidicola]
MPTAGPGRGLAPVAIHAPLLLLRRRELRRPKLLHHHCCHCAPLLDPGWPPPPLVHRSLAADAALSRGPESNREKNDASPTDPRELAPDASPAWSGSVPLRSTARRAVVHSSARAEPTTSRVTAGWYLARHGAELAGAG